MENISIRDLSIELTVKITNLCANITGKSVFVNQLLRCCSSIGANVSEAKYAQSRADFISKMEIALKETYETEYWLEILFKTNSLDENTYQNFLNECGVIRRKLIATVKTAKSKQ